MELKPGYKQTEVGLIPEDWEVRRLGEIGDCLIGLTYKPSDVSTHGLLVLRSSNVAGGQLRFEDNVFVNINVPDKIIVRKGDILICVRNGSRKLIGKCALINEYAEGMTFGAFMSVFRTPHASFIFSQFQSHHIKKQIQGHLGATINQITNKSLNSFRIPFPKGENEQRAITAALSDMDALINGLDKLIAKKRDIKQAVMQQLLTGKQRLPGFSGDWATHKLSQLGRFSKGLGIKRDDVTDEGVGCIRYGEIYTRYENYVNYPVSRTSKSVAAGALLLRKDDLLFTGSGETAEEIGKCVAYLCEDEAYAGGDIIVLTQSGQNSMYLGFLLNHPTVAHYKARLGQGDAVVHISASNLGKLELLLPLIDEQTAIAAVLADMDADISVLERRRDKTRALKQGMMQELLTGRIRLFSRTSIDVLQKRTSKTKPHNWSINEAVVISVLTKDFGNEKYPLGRKRYTKFSYLLHRHAEGVAEGYMKKAAGPYNPKTKYKGPEKIALKNGYVREHVSGKYKGFVTSKKIDQAESYFEKWYGDEPRVWLEQFRRETNDQLGLLTTVDMAMVELRHTGMRLSVESVKDIIRNHPEWEAKLTQPTFSDTNIARAIQKCGALFEETEHQPPAGASK